MVNKELFMALEMLEKEKGIPMDVLCEGIQKALVTAVKRDYNNKDIVFCELDPEKKTMRVFVRKNVVSEVVDPDEDLTVEQAQKYKPTAMVGDIIEIELETKEVSRIAADKGKHVIRQGIREAEHGRLREEFQTHNQFRELIPRLRTLSLKSARLRSRSSEANRSRMKHFFRVCLSRSTLLELPTQRKAEEDRELQFPERIPVL